MRKLISIILLFFLGFYLFTFKTHFCYHGGTHERTHTWHDHDGNIQHCYYHETNERYHGDCQWYIKEAAQKGELADANIFPNYYYCINITKNAQIEETKDHIVKTDQQNLHFPSPVQITKNIFVQECILPLEVDCRDGPPLFTFYLRGPPLV